MKFWYMLQLELWNHAKWKKPDTKDHMFYDSIYGKCQEWTNPQGQED